MSSTDRFHTTMIDTTVLARKFREECQRLAAVYPSAANNRTDRYWAATRLAMFDDFNKSLRYFEAAITRHFTNHHVLYLLRKGDNTIKDKTPEMADLAILETLI